MRVSGTNMMLMTIMYINMTRPPTTAAEKKKKKCKVCLAASTRSIMPSDLAANDPGVLKETNTTKCLRGGRSRAGEEDNRAEVVGVGGVEIGFHCARGAVGSNPTEWKEIRGLERKCNNDDGAAE